jgi:hypothetical protein
MRISRFEPNGPRDGEQGSLIDEKRRGRKKDFVCRLLLLDKEEASANLLAILDVLVTKEADQ